MNAREATFLSLLRAEKEGKYLNLELDAAIRHTQLDERDRALFTALLYGTAERQITLDYVISLYSHIPLARMDNKVRLILRIGTYQILYCDRIPDSAACNESVELCKKHLNRGAASFVNAVLREIIRQKAAIPYPDSRQDPIGYLSTFYSFPRWMCQMWEREYGFARTANLLKAFNTHPPLTLHVNTLRISRDDYLKRLLQVNIEAQPDALAPHAIHIHTHTPIASLPGYEEGDFFVQDTASQLCAMALDAQPGEEIIDCCACPGGKSFAIAIAMQNRGKLHSFDLHQSKLRLITNGAARLGINIISASVRDGGTFDELLSESADRVLCDVPCSGLGVIAKKPDLRAKEPETLTRLPEVQYRILETNARYLRPGGVLVYSTCTINRHENEEVIDRFLKANICFEIDPSFPMKTFYPDTDQTDGFFVAKLRKH